MRKLLMGIVVGLFGSILIVGSILVGVFFFKINTVPSIEYVLEDDEESNKDKYIGMTEIVDSETKVVITVKEETEHIALSDLYKSNENQLNILILGVDTKSNKIDYGRTDAIIVLQLDKEHDKMTMVSIPRDSYVEINNKGYNDKINHAYNKGIESTKTTVENLMGIEFDYWTVINFSSFVQIIDALGGIEVDVPFDFVEQNSDREMGTLKFVKGFQVLDGEKALAYARMRKQDPKGDIGRGGRQQEVIEAVLKELTDFSSVTKYAEMYSILGENIRTNVGITDVTSVLPFIRNYKNTETYTLEGRGMMINKIYYYDLDKTYLRGVIEGLTTSPKMVYANKKAEEDEEGEEAQ